MSLLACVAHHDGWASNQVDGRGDGPRENILGKIESINSENYRSYEYANSTSKHTNKAIYGKHEIKI